MSNSSHLDIGSSGRRIESEVCIRWVIAENSKLCDDGSSVVMFSARKIAMDGFSEIFRCFRLAVLVHSPPRCCRCDSIARLSRAIRRRRGRRKKFFWRLRGV